MDKVHPRGYSRVVRVHHDRAADLRHRRAAAEFLAAVPGHRRAVVGRRNVLLLLIALPDRVSSAGLRVEVVSFGVQPVGRIKLMPQLSPDVLPYAVPHRAGDTEVQPVRLPPATGAVSPDSNGEAPLRSDSKKPSRRSGPRSVCADSGASRSARPRRTTRTRRG